MIANVNPHQRLLQGLPLQPWILEESVFNDNNWHDLVTPPAGMRIVVTDLFGALYVNNAFAHLEWGFNLAAVNHVHPMWMSYECKHFAFRTFWIIPVDAILGIQREAGTAQYCVSGLGFFATEDIMMPTIFQAT